MLEEYKESALRILEPIETLAHAKSTYENGLDFETVLSCLDFSVEKTTPSPEAIQKLNDLDIFVYNKLDMLLAALGEKPASHITFALNEVKDGEGENVSQDNFDKIAEAAEALGLSAYTDTRTFPEPGSAPYQVHSFSFSRSEENAKLVSDIFWSDAEIDELILGKLLGFPDTATSAFVTQTGMIPVQGRTFETPEDKAFTEFRMSAEHVKEELKTVRRWAAATKAADKPLYDEIMEYSSN